MRAMVVTELSGPEGIVAQEVPEPAAEGLVLIDVKASGVCFPTYSSPTASIRSARNRRSFPARRSRASWSPRRKGRVSLRAIVFSRPRIWAAMQSGLPSTRRRYSEFRTDSPSTRRPL